jgi:hypothetical protein
MAAIIIYFLLNTPLLVTILIAIYYRNFFVVLSLILASTLVFAVFGYFLSLTHQFPDISGRLLAQAFIGILINRILVLTKKKPSLTANRPSIVFIIIIIFLLQFMAFSYLATNSVIREAEKSLPGKYHSEYHRAGYSASNTATITNISNNQTSTREYKISVTVKAAKCTGEVEATGTSVKNAVVFTSNTEPKCILTVKPDKDFQTLEIFEGEQCFNFHGFECGFNGNYSHVQDDQ